MRDFFEIFNAKMAFIAGDPKAAKWKIDKAFFIKGQEPQIIGPLLYAYDTKSPDNEWYRNEFLLEAASYIALEVMKNKKYGGLRRYLPVLAEAYPLIAKYLPKIKSAYEKYMFNFASFFAHEIINRKDIKQLTSANVGYGTNHLSVELKGIIQYEKYCSEKIGKLKGIDLKFLKNYLKNFMEYMHEDGYWAECDGPALNYNTLTGVSLMGAAHELGEMKKYMTHFKRVAEFHTSVTLPNGRYIDILDGRNSGCVYSGRGAFLTLTPEGNTLYDSMINTIKKSIDDLVYIGEPLALLLFDEKMKAKYGVKSTKKFWDKKNLEIKLKDFLIVKNNSWISGVSNLKFRPRPEGHFNFDFQNLFSLYHTDYGVIFGGQNSKNDPEISTFSKFMNKFDGYPVQKPMPKYVPGNGAIQFKKNQLSVRRDYRGFEGELKVNFINSHKIELEVVAYARADEYPISFNLILPCSTTHALKDSRGKQINLNEKAKDLSVLKTGPHIFIDQNAGGDNPTVHKNKKLKISVPKNAAVKWPFKPWDTYNLVSDRELLPKNWFCLLVVNVSSQPTKVVIEIV
jgi:hypothetical protein